jgi:hypothetical protein
MRLPICSLRIISSAGMATALAWRAFGAPAAARTLEVAFGAYLLLVSLRFVSLI